MSAQVRAASAPQSGSISDTLLDGLFTGVIGALAVAIWFLILDFAAGRPLYTPALLGSVLLGGGSGPVGVEPLPVAVYTAVHIGSFVGVGIVFSYLMNLFEKFPIIFFVLLVAFLSLSAGFFVLDIALGAQLTGKLSAWSVVVANLLATAGMAIYQWKRHPGAFKKVDRLWVDEDDA